MEHERVNTEEKQLVIGCKNGEAWAQKQVYDQYAPAMMSVCMRYVNKREVAQDILQDGFIKIFTNVESYLGVGSFSGWVKKIFVNTSLEYLRKMNINHKIDAIDDLTTDIQDDTMSIVEKISVDDLMDCICTLPNGYRTVFNLYAIEGYSHAEIAELLQISENTSRSQYMRARTFLQEKIRALNTELYSQQKKQKLSR